MVGLLYNSVFDVFDARAGRLSSDRSRLGRILHAVGFELTLLMVSLPLYVWWLDLAILAAVMMDLTVTIFIVGYTYVFTLAYDRAFPVTQPLDMKPGLQK